MNKLYLFCLRQHACDFKNLKVRPRGQEREIFLSEVESLVLIMVDYKEGDKNAKNWLRNILICEQPLVISMGRVVSTTVWCCFIDLWLWYPLNVVRFQNAWYPWTQLIELYKYSVEPI